MKNSTLFFFTTSIFLSLLIKETITDDVDIEEPIATETSYNLGENQPYQYLQPVLQPDSINQHIRKQPRPFRRQSLDIQEIQAQALEPVTSVLGPDAALTISIVAILISTVSAIALAVIYTAQQSICDTSKQLGDTSLSTVTLDVNADGDTTDTQDTDVSNAINTIINKLNNYATPSC